MNESLKQRIVQAFSRIPEGFRSRPASEEELQAFEDGFGTIPEDFRWFLKACGGGAVGSEWTDGIEELPETHRQFRKGLEDGFWTMSGVFIIGSDGGGNPYGIEVATGRIIVEDHDFGGIHEMAPSFEEFLKKGLLKE